MFNLDGQLASDCIVLGDFKLCTLLLMNDAQYPWFILVHHVVRYRKDVAWPAPVWGKLPAVSCTPELVKERVGRLRAVLTNGFTFAESCP